MVLAAVRRGADGGDCGEGDYGGVPPCSVAAGPGMADAVGGRNAACRFGGDGNGCGHPTLKHGRRASE